MTGVQQTDEPAPSFVDYAEFGRRFFTTAVTGERIENALTHLDGRDIDVGPMGVGPGGFVKVRAKGKVGRPTVTERPHPEHVSFDLTIPVDLAMTIEISFDKHRFDARVIIRLRLTARAAEPLLIVIDVDPPTRDDVEVEVTADGLRASVLQVVAGVDGELRRAVAKYVLREVDQPSTREARTIDVAKALTKL